MAATAEIAIHGQGLVGVCAVFVVAVIDQLRAVGERQVGEVGVACHEPLAGGAIHGEVDHAIGGGAGGAIEVGAGGHFQVDDAGLVGIQGNALAVLHVTGRAAVQAVHRGCLGANQRVGAGGVERTVAIGDGDAGVAAQVDLAATVAVLVCRRLRVDAVCVGFLGGNTGIAEADNAAAVGIDGMGRAALADDGAAVAENYFGVAPVGIGGQRSIACIDSVTRSVDRIRATSVGGDLRAGAQFDEVFASVLRGVGAHTHTRSFGGDDGAVADTHFRVERVLGHVDAVRRAALGDDVQLVDGDLAPTVVGLNGVRLAGGRGNRHILEGVLRAVAVDAETGGREGLILASGIDHDLFVGRRIARGPVDAGRAVQRRAVYRAGAGGGASAMGKHAGGQGDVDGQQSFLEAHCIPPCARSLGERMRIPAQGAVHWLKSGSLGFQERILPAPGDGA